MEKNRDILIKALRNLPAYSPEDKVWEKVLTRLNNNVLTHGLNQLGTFDPPDTVWNNISNELTTREKSPSLNQYDPPEKVWENIDSRLTAKEANRVKKQIIRLFQWTSAVAAIFVLGLFIYTYINTNNSNLSYSEEWMEYGDLQSWNEDNYLVEYALVLICEENPIACKSTEFKEMKEELTFLDQSKQTILQQMNKYDTNTELEILLTKIELERSSLIKEMIAITI